MKQLLCTSSIFLFTLLLTQSGCKKDVPTTGVTTPITAPPPPPLPNTAPQVNAGQNIWIIVPAHSAILSGWAYDAEQNVEKYLWKQVYGPSSSILERPDTTTTRVSNLEKGTYGFELTATDKGGLSGKDTITVFASDPATPGQKEVVFKDLQWMCPWGCSLVIDCLSCSVPANQPFKVYLKTDGSHQWLEVGTWSLAGLNDAYTYSVSNNALVIYTDQDLFDSPDVKIVY